MRRRYLLSLAAGLLVGSPAALGAASSGEAAATSAASSTTSTDAPLDDGSGGGFRGQGSFLSGRTIGQGSDGILAELGWPGFSFGFLHGYTDRVDLGARVTLNYAYEGTNAIDPGMALQGNLRLTLADEGRVNLGLRFDPGLLFYFLDTTQMGIALNAAAVLGVSLGDAMMFTLGADVPMAVFVVPDGVLEVPVLVGFGFEYHLDSHLTLGADFRFGPDVFVGHDAHTQFALKALLALGYRF